MRLISAGGIGCPGEASSAFVSELRAIGRFQVLGVLGEGATARVLLAALEGSPELVVLKRLHPHLARDEAFVEQFRREAALAPALRHPNVVCVRELVEDQGEHLLVMDWVNGHSLREVVGRAPLHPALAAKVVSDVLLGLRHVHRATAPDGAPLGLLHRDLTPENVLVSLEGEVKLTDFGLTGARGGRVGKRGYLAPEVMAGEPPSVKSDVYSAGVLLLEAITGSPDPAGRTQVEALDALLTAVMAAEPSRRPSAGGFLRGLEAARRSPSLYATKESLAALVKRLGGRRSSAEWLRETSHLTGKAFTPRG